MNKLKSNASLCSVLFPWIMASCYGSSGSNSECDVPPAPTLLSPHNGEKIKSARPTFAWRSDLDTSCPDLPAYEIQVDDSYATPGFSTCDFPSPEISNTGIAEETFTPGADLPVGAATPMGRRYYWRVRSCYGSSCSEWSATRYVIVGKGWHIDFNGDGTSDLAVGSNFYFHDSAEPGKAYIYYGPLMDDLYIGDVFSLRLENPDHLGCDYFGTSLAGGDFNGDGFTDLAVGAPEHDAGETYSGQVFIYYGSASGLPGTPSAVLENPQPQGESGFGSSIDNAGDVNADGFDDLVAGVPYYDGEFEEDGLAALFNGSPSGLSGEPSVLLSSPERCWWGEFGHVAAHGGDVDGDGFGDVIVVSHCFDALGYGTGKTFVFHGSPSGIDPSRYDKIEYSETTTAFVKSGNRRYAGSAGDMNADGFNDIAIGFFWQTAASIYFGSPEGINGSAPVQLSNPADSPADRFGTSVASLGDFDGDGYGDMIVGRPDSPPAGLYKEMGVIYYGSPSGVEEQPYLCFSGDAIYLSSMFASTGTPGDLDGDGILDIAAGGPMKSRSDIPTGLVFVFRGSSGGTVQEEPIFILSPDDDGSLSIYPRFGISLATGNYN